MPITSLCLNALRSEVRTWLSPSRLLRSGWQPQLVSQVINGQMGGHIRGGRVGRILWLVVLDTKFRFTDPFFAKVIFDISDNNSLFFTPKQFLYLLDRRLKSRLPVSGLSWLVVYAFFSIWISGFIDNLLSNIISNLAFIVVLIALNIGFIARFFLEAVPAILTIKVAKPTPEVYKY